ncbi:uncharacterized protein ACN427_011840 isoform 2-T3 [Glossina fuscipes fuscipes]
MEIMANASNHNQNHQHQQQQELGLLVAIPKRQQLQQQEHYSHHYNSEATGSKAVVPGSHLPFQREVREWQRIDPDTGALHSGRLEADRWINGPLNSYGKISDSKNISQPNGTQHIQRKQLEVLQACTEHGTMQVIRAQTVQATSSRWSISSASPVLALSPTSSITATSTKTTTTTTPQLQKTVKQYLKNKNNSNKKPVHNHSSTTSSNAIIITTSCSSNSSASSSISSSPLTNGYYRDHRNEREDYLPTAIDKHWPQQLTDKMSNLHMDNEQQQHRHYNHDDYHCNGDVSDHDNDMLLLDADNPYLKSSSTLSTTGSTGQTLYVSTVSSKPASMNTYKSGVNKISLHAIVGNGSGSGSINKLSTLQQQQHQPTLFSQNDNISIIKNSNNNDNNNNNNNNNNNSNQSHLLKTRVGANINCNFDGGDEYQTSAKTTKMTTATAATPSPTVTVTLETRHHQHHHNDRLTPTQSIGVHTQQKRDEENFRHYVNSDVPFNEQDANDLRLSTRQLRRQQIPLNTSLQRSYSISTDDLSSEWNVDGHAEEIGKEEPAEWRRVSKLRRSFQSSNKTNESLKSPAPLRKPLDLPENSVSVSKIKADLENGRRLSTVMRNNRVDLTALNTLLQSDEINGREDHKTHLTKKNSFLTAESLKEIRNKLKKLSDESLYKEDFKIHQSQQQPTNEEAFNEELTERFKPVGDKKQANLTFVNVTGKHASNSLESRLKYKDPNSTEWHLRRKSYGFEKMSPPEYKAMFCMDDSTDSGLGRSGELGNWSPISDTSCKTNSRNSTIIHLEETAKSKKDSHLSRGYLTQKLVEKEREISPVDKQYDMKRHSIAIDDIHYDLENPRQTTQIHLNGVYEDSNDSLHTTSQKSQQKRVEFCKTEVHFATESGRVNIVETDSKPPPTNNFRRRRRSSSVGPLQSLVKSVSAVHTSASPITTTTATVAVPITIFGESSLKRATINTAPIAQRICLEPSPEPKTDSAINVTITVPSKNDLLPNYASTSGVDSTDCDTDEFISLRGILKNKPIKPKPYVLGENIENSKALWSTYKKLETVDDDSKSCSPPPFLLASQRTVAERIRLVEQQQQQQQDTGPKCSSPTSNFSTKINVNLGDRSTSWQEAGSDIGDIPTRPTAQALLLQDLKENQRILDEGLKSTNLIIKTLRSANEFDEAMRRLYSTDVESNYTTPVVVPTPMFRSHNLQESLKCNSLGSTGLEYTKAYNCVTLRSDSITSMRKEISDSATRKNATEHHSLMGNEQGDSQQLQRLRMIYDATLTQGEDSADEEVKGYFKDFIDIAYDDNSATQKPSLVGDNNYQPYSNDLKVAKTVWRINTKNHITTKEAREQSDLPLSNVVSIKFHSPQMKKEIDSTYTGSIKTSEALPPNLSNTHESTATLKQSPRQSIAIAKEALKIVKEARGARQLREHELSYFGVSKDKNNVQPLKTKLYSTPSPSVSTKRTLPSRRLSEGNPLINKEWPNKDNKPDLLKHSEIQMREITKEPKASERSSLLTTKNDLNSDEEHLYENIANDITPTFKVQSPSLSRAYDRKADLQRDAMILKEMNTNADQTLKDLSDETILRDRRRRSMQRRNSKPLETIEEKSAPEKSVESPAMVVKVDRATYSSEAKRIARRSTASPSSAKQRERTSSQSSVECCPRARSRSLSSEKEFETLKMKQAPNSAAVKHKSYKTANARSYSRESQNSSHSQCSSTDEQLFDSFRREERSRAKTKRHTNSSTKALKQTTIQSNQKEDAKRLSSTARSSTHRERVRCKMETVAKPSQHQNQTNPSLFRSTNSSGESGRRQRDELKDLQQSVKYCDTTAANISANNNKHSSKYDDKKKATSQEISSFKHVEQNNESEEKHIKPKAHSSRSTSKQRRHQHPEAQLKAITREREQLKSRTTKASTAAINENTTYVSVSNLRQVQTALCTSDTNVNNEIMQTAAVIADTNIYEKSENFEAIDQSIKQSLQSQIPIKPPRKKRYKKSLIPIAIPTKPERLPPLSPSQKLQIEKIPSPPSYEYQVKTQIIPPSYSNQSTLKKSSLPRPTSRLSFLTKARKSSHKYAHSTSSSFAFLPYLPAKRNSDVSHIYDNYMLYAVPASINAKAYKQNLVNDHAHLFGGTGHRYYNDGGKGLRRRTVRSTVSTHQPFGICTCS